MTVLELEDTQRDLETLKAYCVRQKCDIERLSGEMASLKETYDAEIERVLSESENVIRNLELSVSQLTIENAHLQAEGEKSAESIAALMEEKSRL